MELQMSYGSARIWFVIASRFWSKLILFSLYLSLSFSQISMICFALRYLSLIVDNFQFMRYNVYHDDWGMLTYRDGNIDTNI